MEEITVADALEVFSLSPSFSIDELRKAYRLIALRVHPDRGGSEELFNTVNECFNVLSLEHNSRSGGALHDQLKRNFDADITTYDASNRRDVNFSLEQFNQVFEQTKVEDEIQNKGYDRWFRDAEDAMQPSLNPKCGRDAFNSAFEKSVPESKEERSIIVRPVDLFESSSLMLTELGGNEIDDFSVSGAFDCRAAYTTQRVSRSAGENKHSRLTPDQISAQREADIAKGLSHAERSALEAEVAREKRLDDARREVEMARHSQRAAAHADANKIMLGFRR